MTCHRHEDALLDIARGVPVDADAGAALAAHIEACAACGARMTRERTTTAGLRAVARSAGGLQPSAAVEASLLGAFRAMRAGVPAAVNHGTGGWRTWTAAAAAVLVMSGGLTFLVWTAASIATARGAPGARRIANRASSPAFR